MVARVQYSVGISEKGAHAGASILSRDSREFIFRRGTGTVRANNDVAERIAIPAATGELITDEPCFLCLSRCFSGRPQSGQSIRQACERNAIFFDRVCEFLHRSDGGLLISLNFRAIPFLAERREIQQQ